MADTPMLSTPTSLSCPDSLLPTKAELINLFNSIANLPAELEASAVGAAEDVKNELKAAADDIRSQLDSIKSILSPYVPNFGDIDIPTLEWTGTISNLVNEYTVYIQAKILELISKVIPVTLTVNLYGIAIDVIAFISNGKDAIRDAIKANIDAVSAAVEETYKAFQGDWGFESKDARAEHIFQIILAELIEWLYNTLHAAFGSLISKFKKIWKLLKLPDLPALMDLKTALNSLIDSAIDAAKAAVQAIKDQLASFTIDGTIASLKGQFDAMKELANSVNGILKDLVSTIEGIGVAGFNVGTIIGGDIKDFALTLEKQIALYRQELNAFAGKWPDYLLKEWIGKVAKFLKMIGLGAILDWVVFTFCDFLALIGVSLAFSISSKYINDTGQANYESSNLGPPHPVTAVDETDWFEGNVEAAWYYDSNSGVFGQDAIDLGAPDYIIVPAFMNKIIKGVVAYDSDIETLYDNDENQLLWIDSFFQEAEPMIPATWPIGTKVVVVT